MIQVIGSLYVIFIRRATTKALVELSARSPSLHTNLVEVSSHYVDVPGQRLQVVIALLGAEVARAQNVLDLPGDQQLLELGWEGVAPVGDVQVT